MTTSGTKAPPAKPSPTSAANGSGSAPTARKAPAPKAASTGAAWLAELDGYEGEDAPFLVERNGSLFLIDNGRRRPVRSGLLAAALEERFGPRRTTNFATFEGWPLSVPVELFQARGEAPFVVINRVRHPVRGFPTPVAVGTEATSLFPRGPVIDVAKANISRQVHARQMAWRYQAARLKATVRRHGVLGVTRKLAKKGLKKGLRRVV